MSMAAPSELPINFTGTLEKMVARGIELTKRLGRKMPPFRVA